MDINRKKRALGYSFATMLILIGVLSLIVVSELTNNDLLSLVVFFACLIPSIGIYVYLGCTAERVDVPQTPNSIKSDALSSAIWLLAITAFFVVGFMFNGWAYAWVSFIVAGAIDSLIKYFNSGK